jgi:hypothetical protein
MITIRLASRYQAEAEYPLERRMAKYEAKDLILLIINAVKKTIPVYLGYCTHLNKILNENNK